MVGRLPISMLCILAFSLSTLAQRDVRYNADGKDGTDGRAGTSHDSSPQYSGTTGRNGGDAGPSTPGKPGGTIELHLSDSASKDPKRAYIEIKANVNGSARNDTLSLSKGSARIKVSARGGKGGDGGRGGDGEGGGKGSDGSDATRHSNGTSGGRGYGGGDSGKGTKGSNGGKGGTIRLRLNSIDSYLTLLVDWENAPGAGGARGQDGRPGEGGRGGRGGSSHSWTTRESYQDRESYQEPYTETYSVSNGNGSFTTKTRTKYRTKYRTVTKYRDKHHSNPGGSDGPRGSSGTRRTGDTSPGSRGEPGTFEILVTDENGKTSKYTQPSNLVLSSYNFFEENGDGIIEPGEKITLENIRVTNRGQIPTPEGKANTLVMLRNSTWVVADPIKLNVPSLSQGESHTLEDVLTFTVRDRPEVGEEDRWKVTDEMMPYSMADRIRHTYEGFKLPKTFTVTYPVEITPFEVKQTVGAGESVPVLFSVRNISKKAHGLDSELARQIQINIEGSGEDTQAQQRMTYDSKTMAINEGMVRDVALLDKGEKLVIEGELQIDEDTEPYTAVDLRADLSLADYNDSELARIQTNTTKVRIGNLYRYSPSSEVLLITNFNTERHEYEAWIEFFRKLGIKFNVWDFGYYGDLSFFKNTPDQTSNLAQNFEGKTVVVLNSIADRDGTRSTVSYIDEMEFFQVAQESRINFYAFGGNGDVVREILTPKNIGRKFHEDLDELVKALAASNYDQAHKIDLKGSKSILFVDATSDKLIAKVEKRLREEYPLDRFALTFSSNEYIEDDGFLIDDYHFGTLSVRKVIQPTLGKLVFLPLDREAEIHSPERITGDESLRAFFLSLHFESKLELLNRALMGTVDLDARTMMALKNAILVDAIEELDFLTETKGIDENRKAQRYERILSLISDYSERQVVRQMIGELGFYVDVLSKDTKNKFTKAAKQRWKDWWKAHKGKPEGDAVQAIWIELKDTVKRRKSRLVDLSRREVVQHMFSLPVTYRAKSTEQILVPSNVLWRAER